MYFRVIGTTVVAWDKDAMPEGEGVPFEVDDGGFLDSIQLNEVPHWDGIDWWTETKPLNIESISILADMLLTDEQAIEVPDLFVQWQAGVAYDADKRVAYGDRLFKCVQAHTSQADWTPDATPSLWVEIAKPGEIPEWRQPAGSHDAYAKGDRVRYGDKVYESIIDGNIWSPEDYPAGWIVVE